MALTDMIEDVEVSSDPYIESLLMQIQDWKDKYNDLKKITDEMGVTE